MKGVHFDLSKEIELQTRILIEKHLDNYKNNGRGISKALMLMKSEIEQMRSDGFSMKDQIIILNSIFKIEIKYDNFKKWSYRTFLKSSKSYPKSKKNTLSKRSVALKKEPDNKIKSPSIEEIFNEDVDIPSELSEYL